MLTTTSRVQVCWRFSLRARTEGTLTNCRAASEVAGTGIGEESRLKGEVVRYKDSIIDKLIAGQGSGKRDVQYPAFTYAPRSLAEIFAGGALFDTVWLVFFNILSFALAYVAFVRYDVR